MAIDRLSIIENLLSRETSSLAELRELYPKITAASKLPETLVGVEPIFLNPEQAKDYGITLDPDWQLKISPAENTQGYSFSLITPDKWEITQDNLFISPTGEQFTQEQLQESLAPAAPISPIPQIDPRTGLPALPPGVVAAGKEPLPQYTPEQLQAQVALFGEAEATLKQMFPDQDFAEAISYLETNPDQFIQDLRDIGRNTATEALVRFLVPNITDDEMRQWFGQVPLDKATSLWEVPLGSYSLRAQEEDAIRTFAFYKPDMFRQALLYETYQSENGLEWARNELKSWGWDDSVIENYLLRDTIGNIVRGEWLPEPLEDYWRAFYGGTGEMLGALANLAPKIGIGVLSEELEMIGLAGSLVTLQMDVGKPYSAGWFGKNLMRMTPMMLALMEVGLLTGGVGANAAAAAGAGTFIQALVGSISAGVSSAVSEGLFEASAAYEEAKSRGLTPGECNAVFNEVLRGNVAVLSGSNAAQFAGGFFFGGRTINLLVKSLMFGFQSASEGLEEGVQLAIVREALGDVQTFDSEMWQNVILGFAGGLGFGGMGAIYDAMKSRVWNKMTQEQKDDLSRTIELGLDEGLTELEATTAAWDEFTGTTEGRELVTETISYQMEEEKQKAVARLSDIQEGMAQIDSFLQENGVPIETSDAATQLAWEYMQGRTDAQGNSVISQINSSNPDLIMPVGGDMGLGINDISRMMDDSSPGALMDIPSSDDIIEGAIVPNWMRSVLGKVAKVPVFKTIETALFGWRSLVNKESDLVEDIVGRGAVVYGMVNRMGSNAARVIVGSLRSLVDNPVKYFGFDKYAYSSKMKARLLPQYRSEWGDAGTLEHVFTKPEMYDWTGLEPGLKYVALIHQLNKSVNALLGREGIGLTLVHDRWIHRVVTGRTIEGEVVSARGRKGRGKKGVGATPSYKKPRTFTTMAQGLSLSVEYDPNIEVSIGSYIEEAFKEVAGERFKKMVEEFGETPADRLKERYPDIVQRAEETKVGLADAARFHEIVLRAKRGEKIPSGTINAMLRRFPDLGRRLAELVADRSDTNKQLRKVIDQNARHIKTLKKQIAELRIARATQGKAAPVGAKVEPEREVEAVAVQLSDIEPHIEAKYGKLPGEESEAEAKVVPLEKLSESELTPEDIAQGLATLTEGELLNEIEAIEASIADSMGELAETYRYESWQEGKAFEEYLDSLLAVTQRYRKQLGQTETVDLTNPALTGTVGKKPKITKAAPPQPIVLPDEVKLTEAFKLMEYGDRLAFRQTMEGQLQELEDAIGEESQLLAGNREYLESDPVASYRAEVIIEPRKVKPFKLVTTPETEGITVEGVGNKITTKQDLTAAEEQFRQNNAKAVEQYLQILSGKGAKPAVKRVSLTDVLKGGEMPETLTPRKAQALLMGRPLTSGAFDKAGNIRWEYIIDELADHFHMGEQELVDKIEYIKALREKTQDLEQIIKSDEARAQGIKKMIKILEGVEGKIDAQAWAEPVKVAPPEPEEAPAPMEGAVGAVVKYRDMTDAQRKMTPAEAIAHHQDVTEWIALTKRRLERLKATQAKHPDWKAFDPMVGEDVGIDIRIEEQEAVLEMYTKEMQGLEEAMEQAGVNPRDAAIVAQWIEAAGQLERAGEETAKSEAGGQEPTREAVEAPKRRFISLTRSSDPTQKTAPWRLAYESKGKEYAYHLTSKAKAIERARATLGVELDPKTLQPIGEVSPTQASEGSREAAFELAKRVYAPYISRGDSLESIVTGQLGYGSKQEGDVTTGGWFEGKKLKPNEVGVKLPDGSQFVFKLADIAKSIQENPPTEVREAPAVYTAKRTVSLVKSTFDDQTYAIHIEGREEAAGAVVAFTQEDALFVNRISIHEQGALTRSVLMELDGLLTNMARNQGKRYVRIASRKENMGLYERAGYTQEADTSTLRKEVREEQAPYTAAPAMSLDQFKTILDRVIDETANELELIRGWFRRWASAGAWGYVTSVDKSEMVANRKLIMERLDSLKAVAKNPEEYYHRLLTEFPNMYKMLYERAWELRIIPRSLPKTIPVVSERGAIYGSTPQQSVEQVMAATEELAQAIRVVQPESVKIGKNIFEREMVGDDLFYTKGEERYPARQVAPVLLNTEQGDSILAEFKKRIPAQITGMPEAGLQVDMFGYTKPVTPKGRGKVVQISMDDYNKLANMSKEKNTTPYAYVKPKIEGVSELEGDTQFQQEILSAPDMRTDQDRAEAFEELAREAKGLMESRKAPYWQAKHARARAMDIVRQAGIGENYLPMPFAGGKIYDQDFVDSCNKFFGVETGHGSLRFIADVAGILRITKASLDFSVAMIQGLTSFGVAHTYLMVNPRVGSKLLGRWYQALGYSVASFFNPGVFYRHMEKNKPKILQRISFGGSSKAIDYFDVLEGKEGIARIAAWTLEHIPLNPFKRAEMSFYAGGELVRNTFWNILSEKAIRQGKGFELARFLDLLTGLSDSQGAGVPLTVRQLESAFMWFAPNYTRACLTIISDIFRGGYTGAMAKKALGGMIGAGVAYYIAIQMAISLLSGGDSDDAWEKMENGLGIRRDPITGEVTWRPRSDFLGIKIENYTFAPGGFWYGMVRLAGNIAETIEEVGDRERIDLVRILKHGAINKDNPFVYWWYTRASPLTGVGFELASHKDFLGYPIETPAEYAYYIMTRFEPIWMESGINWLIPGLTRNYEIPEGAARAAIIPFELFGWRSVPESSWTSFYDKVKEYVLQLPRAELDPKQIQAWEAGKLGWAQLTDKQQQDLLNRYPELAQLYETAQNDSKIRETPEWKAYTERIEEERAVYYGRIDELTARLLAGEISTTEYRELCSEAGQNYGAIMDSVSRDPAYASIFEYFEEKEAEGSKYQFTFDLALAEYDSTIRFAEDPGIYLTNGDYNWDERDRRTDAFIEKWGMELYQQILSYVNTDKADKGLNPLWIRRSEDTEKLSREYWQLPYQAIKDMTEQDQAEGNIPAEYYGLWREYQGLSESDKEAFLIEHPDFAKDWRAEYRRTHPQEDAMLALWGYSGRLQSMEAYNLVKQWGAELGIPLSQMGLGLPPETLVVDYFDYNELASQFSSNSAEAKLWRLENPEFTNWAMESWGWEGTEDYKSLRYYQLQVEWRTQEAEYDAIDSDNEEARVAYLKGHGDFWAARLVMRLEDMERSGNYDFPDALEPDYVAWYQLSGDFKDYEDEWWLMAHPKFYDTMMELGIWTEPRDFSKVPTKQVWGLYQGYLKLPKGQPRLDYRIDHPELDAWLVLAKGYKPAEGRGEATEQVTPWEELAAVETFKELFD